jgi:signal transduction histidine kinase
MSFRREGFDTAMPNQTLTAHAMKWYGELSTACSENDCWSRWQTSVAVATAVIALPMLFIAAITKFNAGEHAPAILGFLFACEILFSLSAIKSGGFGIGMKNLFRLNCLSAAIYFFVNMTADTGDTNRMFWVYLFPMIAFFLLSNTEALLWCAAFYTGCAILLLTSGNLEMSFSISFLGTCAFGYVFQSVCRRSDQRLKAFLSEHENQQARLMAANKALEAATRAKSDFLANMSHELRTPLNHIIGFTELVMSKNFGEINASQEEFLGDVLSGSRNLLSLINDIVDLAKIESNRDELELSDVPIKVLLQSSLVMIKEKAVKHRITIKTHLDTMPEIIRADERKIKQILYNLLSNAVNFTPDGGEVTLSAQRLDGADGNLREGDGGVVKVPANYSPLAACKGELILVTVADTGIGLASGDLERIFLPFEKVDKPSDMHSGAGMGLSLTKGFVELHGGMIWAESPGEGKGSTFFLILPTDPETRKQSD